MTEQPIRTLLGNLSCELKRLAMLAGTIDAAVGHLPLAALHGETAGALQRIDLLRQSLECLGRYSGTLAALVDASAQVDPTQAVTALPLRDLAHALAAHTEPELAANEESGNETWFV